MTFDLSKIMNTRMKGNTRFGLLYVHVYPIDLDIAC